MYFQPRAQAICFQRIFAKLTVQWVLNESAVLRNEALCSRLLVTFTQSFFQIYDAMHTTNFRNLYQRGLMLMLLLFPPFLYIFIWNNSFFFFFAITCLPAFSGLESFLLNHLLKRWNQMENARYMQVAILDTLKFSIPNFGLKCLSQITSIPSYKWTRKLHMLLAIKFKIPNQQKLIDTILDVVWENYTCI